MTNPLPERKVPKERKVPMRKCLGCNEMKPKRELIRAVRNPEGAITLDKTGKLNGRGAYMCPDPECFKKLRKRKGLERAFKCQAPAELYEALEEALQNE